MVTRRVSKKKSKHKHTITNEYAKLKTKFKGYTSYMTHFNGSRPYLCYIKKNDVYIYKKKTNDFVYEKKTYTKLVKHYKASKVFIGKDTATSYGSDLDNTTKDRRFSIGNTILVKLSKKKYVYIGDEIVYEFSTEDEITKYFSLIGGNDAPYPVALGKDNVYFMLDKVYIPKKYFPSSMKQADFEDAYQLFYDYDYIEDERKLSNDTKKYKFKKMKMIDSI
jgi:hypothetical protein